jgi:hypothetical protein
MKKEAEKLRKRYGILREKFFMDLIQTLTDGLKRVFL